MKSCTFAIWTSQNRQIPRTRMQKRKSDFLQLFYFLKFSHFHHFLTDGSNPYVFPGQINDFSVQTLQNALFALFRYLAPPSDPSAPALMFSQVNSMILGAQSALFAKKRTFLTFSTLGSPKSFKNDSVLKRFGGHHIIRELLAKKCTFGALGAHWVPWLSGWLAEG